MPVPHGSPCARLLHGATHCGIWHIAARGELAVVCMLMRCNDFLALMPCLQESIVIVEYPKKLAALVRPTLGPLEKLRDRRYGRTYLAIYGPPSAA